MRESKLKAVVISTDLKAYKLTKALSNRLADFDEMCTYAAKAGRAMPPHCRLFNADYLALDRLVVEQSQGKHSIASVRWNGYAIISNVATPQAATA